MARYTDVDALLNKLPDDLPYKASVKRVLIQAPVADVVPKSEVAREIFEEIEKSVVSKIPMKFTPIFKRDLGYDAGVIDGKHDAFFEVLVLISELKKKYTEEKG